MSVAEPGPDEVDQDAMAAAWADMAGLDDESAGEPGGATPPGGDEPIDERSLVESWTKVLESDDLAPPIAASAPVREEGRALSQNEIDNLLGVGGESGSNRKSGIQSLINSNEVTYERLPMLEIVFDRLERMLTTSVRNFTSENVDINLEDIKAQRFGDYLNSVPLPAMLSVFKAIEWDNYGLIVVDSPMIYSIVDVLLGGRRGTAPMRIEGRPYTTIEANLIERLIRLILADLTLAFAPITKVEFRFERMETNPRFAAIARPGNACVVFKLRIDMEDRGGTIEFLLPYATLEPARDVLLQMFMGEKFGRDSIWEGHLARELMVTQIELQAVLDEQTVTLGQAMGFRVGTVLQLGCAPNAPVQLRCGGVPMLTGRLGRIRDRLAIEVQDRIARAVPGDAGGGRG
jgi:flagellar motor switch protein FliM